MDLYIGIDPGQTTGAAVIYADCESITIHSAHDVPGGVEGFLEWWEAQVLSWGGVRPLAVIVEAFTLREGKHGVDIMPRDVIGAVKAECKRLGLVVEMRPAGGRLKQMPDEAMKKLGVYLPGKKNRNAREAVRHVLAYLKTRGNRSILGVFNGPV